MPDVAARRRRLPTSGFPVGPSAPPPRLARRRTASCRACHGVLIADSAGGCGAAAVCAPPGVLLSVAAGPARHVVCVLARDWRAPRSRVFPGAAPWPAINGPLHSRAATGTSLDGRAPVPSSSCCLPGEAGDAQRSLAGRSVDLVCGAGPPHRARRAPRSRRVRCSSTTVQARRIDPGSLHPSFPNEDGETDSHAPALTNARAPTH